MIIYLLPVDTDDDISRMDRAGQLNGDLHDRGFACLTVTLILIVDAGHVHIIARIEAIAALEDRTCIAVTHRPAAVELCDWELKVCDGKIRAIRK